MATEIDDKLIRMDDGKVVVGSAETVRIDEEEARKVALYECFHEANSIPAEMYATADVKRGLRNADGTGVLAGVTRISNVHGYELQDGKKIPVEGSLKFRGYELADLIGPSSPDYRFNFEEVAYLLLMGKLPTPDELTRFVEVIDSQRELPDGFTASMVMRGPAPHLMNMLSRSVLQLYAYDEHAEERTPAHEIHTALSLISRLPRIMVLSYYSKRASFFHESMIMHRFIPGQSTSETILSMLRPDRQFTPEEARMLDVMLCLHAEHGGGNNSTFTTRVLSSSDTDPYSTYAAAIGSLKGYRHGGANHKVRAMHADMKASIPEERWDDEGAIADYLRRVVAREAYDQTGLIYGMGHAVYTLSDPRAVILKQFARELAEGSEFERELRMLEAIERISPEVFAEARSKKAGSADGTAAAAGETGRPAAIKPLCANVDMYSGFVYSMMGIPEDLFTPLFACARMAGWSAHRFEEIASSKRIIRPAYKNMDIEPGSYVSRDERS